jgi:hypothetical protein
MKYLISLTAAFILHCDTVEQSHEHRNDCDSRRFITQHFTEKWRIHAAKGLTISTHKSGTIVAICGVLFGHNMNMRWSIWVHREKEIFCDSWSALPELIVTKDNRGDFQTISKNLTVSKLPTKG